MTRADANPPRTLAELIRSKLALQAELDVLTFVDVDARGDFHTEVRTYAQLHAHAMQIAGALLDCGVRAGETFALVLHNHPQFVEAMIAASMIGAVFVPIDARSTPSALKQRLGLAKCKAAIVGDYALDALLSICSELSLERVWVVPTRDAFSAPPGVIDLTDVMRAPAPSVEAAPTDENSIMQLLFTSGTTGEPKAIASPQRRFMNSGKAAAGMFGLTASDRPYTGLSFVHANAQLVTLGAVLYMGLRGVISRRFTKTHLWEITRRYGCTMFNLLGGMAVALYSEPERADDADNPVRRVISAGMSIALWEKFARRFDVEILEFYGAAEGGLTINPPGVGPVGSVGKPPPGYEVAILDGRGQICPPGEAGEICFRLLGGVAPSVRYFNDPLASAKKTAGDWLHMGDVGHLDEDGWLYFHYRMGEGVRRNGEFIDAAAIERVLAEHALISDVFVYGVPSGSGAPGEKDVVAAIVPKANDALDMQSVFDYCREQLPGNHVPSYLQVLDELPKTASEKPQQHVLADRFIREPGRVFTDRGARRRSTAEG